MTDIVDFSRIQETSDGDMEFEGELIEMYLEDAREHLNNILGLLGGSDAETLKSASHTLKGSSANIGAVGVQTVAGAIEKAAADGQVAPASEGEDLKAVLDKTEVVFREYLEANT